MNLLSSSFIALPLILISTLTGNAQSMVVPIPTNAQVVEDTLISNNTGTYRLCGDGGTIAVAGNSNVIYVDGKTTTRLEGNGNTLYSTSTGDVIVEGNSNVVYTNASLIVSIEGSGNLLHTPAAVKANFIGPNTRVVIGGVRFDYSNVPGGGCAPRNATDVARNLALTPNPVGTGNILTLTSDKKPQSEVRLTDWEGRVIRTYEAGSQKLSLRDIPPGNFWVKFTLDDEAVSMPVTIQ